MSNKSIDTVRGYGGQARRRHILSMLSVAMVGVLLSCSPLAASDVTKDGWLVLSDDLSAFQEPTGEWFMADDARLDTKNDKHLTGDPGCGVLINGKSGVTDNLITRKQWGGVEVSLEFMISRNSNSGVKLQGVYEIQIVDSWRVVKLTGSDCGGIYPRAEMTPKYHVTDAGVPPRVNAARAPGRWQTLDVVFRAPRFDKSGHKVSNARFEKVALNGRLIHDNIEVAHPTGHRWREPEHAVGPLHLQADHGPVAFRNVRLRPLATASNP
ncbi:MAG: DUF1080 domain-containing protein [Pirellulaceae bacterium]